MKILFHFTIALLVLSLAACNQTKEPGTGKAIYIYRRQGRR